MGEGLSKKRTGLRPNWVNHDKNTCLVINYFADREHMSLILLRQEIEIEQGCYYCKKWEKCKKLDEYLAEFTKKGFWTFNKNVKAYNVVDPDWSIENKFFSMQPL